MIGEEMYHKIKAVRASNTVRETAQIVGVSTGTVQKYSKFDISSASEVFKDKTRTSQFDIALEFIVDQLSRHNKIRTTKLLRKVKHLYPEITAKERAFRNYIAPIREKYRNSKIRYYHPVVEKKDNCQIQVDPGESYVKMDGSGNFFKVYFVVFVFSYSRLMFVSFQVRPYNTDDFIKAHLEAFNYFGGVAKEFVYDQTKLVVIREKYREVWFNEKFHQFANKHEFLPIVCEGYDPESKGKVERAVQYVKNDFLYGDYFCNVEAVRKLSLIWLNEVANVRIHGTTQRKPVELFLEEKPYLKNNSIFKDNRNIRKVDKVGLISYESNKYSVPFIYQRKDVVVTRDGNDLKIYDVLTNEEIACHKISCFKNMMITNYNHYRDIRKSIEQVTEEVLSCLEGISLAKDVVQKIKADNPKIIREQLVGLKKLRNKYDIELFNEVVPELIELPQVRCSILEDILKALYKKKEVQKVKEKNKSKDHKTLTSSLTRSLEVYNKKVKNVR